MRLYSAALLAVMAGPTLEASSTSSSPVTMTGWFSDERCATRSVKAGYISPNNPQCVTRCLSQGATPVFISEQAKALFVVIGHPTVKDDVGWHVQITGTVGPTGKSIEVSAVKRMAFVGASCALRKRPSP